MDRALLALAALFTLAQAASAQTRIPAEAEPRPPRSPAEPAAPAPPTPAEPSSSKPRGSVLEEVSGTVRGIDRKDHRLTVDTGAGGTVALSLDRNTMVYTPKGLGTVLDIETGAQVRAGRNADFLAYWVQVRGAPASTAPAAPAAGTASGPPPSETGGAPAVPAPAGPVPGGGAPVTGGGTGH